LERISHWQGEARGGESSNGLGAKKEIKEEKKILPLGGDIANPRTKASGIMGIEIEAKKRKENAPSQSYS